jgi:quinohemoprotein ethanol dehydrogenase
LWSFPAQAPISSAPITYEAKGRQYVSILVGFGTSAAVLAKLLNLRSVDYFTQAKRVLTFSLDSKGALPPAEKWTATAFADPTFTPDPALAQRGAETYGRRCLQCRGIDAVSGGAAPDLRASAIPQSAEAFASVVRDGARLSNGMPRFDYLDNAQLNALRQYLRTEAGKLRAAQGKP